ncbi:LysR family transcriptional regulator [Rhodobacter capsulatus]|jgi:DNA-binding transcriptional LysR family regulator|uniref:Transcriptional regulator, LysR family n=1 Tax=Rhodobacter capsulatus (strain ATCC BAA-309 / NBRC 16581 / SB1003) TaxID=272942 RepID=D5AM66_RHOCB|nr:LysR family transcriptional regulator [Rhodobacter capsulatus]ADE84136.1 transcriptional regulator, LysR family [Rhodobacter capsulatus SB 1003]ETD86086.1 LysR family transcriptional regulator [Rhodobacter capsulatus YW1]ETD88279.1 LysR family transcriptional regulator [Rhodobacter capsulatus YW2]MDS0925820.1 LysR family transcriptional regulator [Rhodobacter capsulatus]TQD36145.1 LysR family transcriptional regulator [Rhodobacter capsulatus]
MRFENWDEIRTAYQVARMGTVSGAAEVLGVHHATVIRHVDALETRLGTKLFQRHPRGYTPTEAGQQLLAVGQATEDQFAQLAARIAGAGEEMRGELIITSLPALAALVMPAMAELMRAHPALVLRYITDPRVFRLEYGEAHVAIRAGARPTEPDNVVSQLGVNRTALYAAPEYIERHGRPKGPNDLAGHRFVGPDSRESRAPFFRWLAGQVPPEAMVFMANEMASQQAAIEAGLGLGFLPVLQGRAIPRLVEVVAPMTDWDSPFWLVTHVDLHRTPKVQAALKALRSAAVRLDPGG